MYQKEIAMNWYISSEMCRLLHVHYKVIMCNQLLNDLFKCVGWVSIWPLTERAISFSLIKLQNSSHSITSHLQLSSRLTSAKPKQRSFLRWLWLFLLRCNQTWIWLGKRRGMWIDKLSFILTFAGFLSMPYTTVYMHTSVHALKH